MRRRNLRKAGARAAKTVGDRRQARIVGVSLDAQSGPRALQTLDPAGRNERVRKIDRSEATELGQGRQAVVGHVGHVQIKLLKTPELVESLQPFVADARAAQSEAR